MFRYLNQRNLFTPSKHIKISNHEILNAKYKGTNITASDYLQAILTNNQEILKEVDLAQGLRNSSFESLAECKGLRNPSFPLAEFKGTNINASDYLQAILTNNQEILKELDLALDSRNKF